MAWELSSRFLTTTFAYPRRERHGLLTKFSLFWEGEKKPDTGTKKEAE